MIPFDRLLMAHAASLAAALLAGIAGGLLAWSWLWAAACAVVVYGACSVCVMVWIARRWKSSDGWPDLDDQWPGE